MDSQYPDSDGDILQSYHTNNNGAVEKRQVHFQLPVPLIEDWERHIEENYTNTKIKSQLCADALVLQMALGEMGLRPAQALTIIQQQREIGDLKQEIIDVIKGENEDTRETIQEAMQQQKQAIQWLID